MKYRDCLKSTPPAKIATIRVVVSGYTPTGTRGAAAGARIWIESELAGVTGNDGSLVVTVAANQPLMVAADDGVGLVGVAEVTATVGTTQQVAIAMKERPVSEPNELLLDEVSADSLLPHDFSTLTFRFAHDENLVALEKLDDVTLESDQGFQRSLRSMFTVNSRGEIVVTKPELVRRAILSSAGPLAIDVDGYDGEGRRFANAFQFELGRHRLASSGDITVGRDPVGHLPEVHGQWTVEGAPGGGCLQLSSNSRSCRLNPCLVDADPRLPCPVVSPMPHPTITNPLTNH